MLTYFWQTQFRGTVEGDSSLFLNDCSVDDGLLHHLVEIAGSIHLVTNMELVGMDCMWLTVKPALRCHGLISGKSFGYVGSYMNELKALIELSKSKHVSNLLMSVLQPKQNHPGDFVSRPLRDGVPINESQRQTVESLKYALEKIQGPPGTGKSTTIFHIVTGRIPLGARVLVTCSRNVAVESLAQKLQLWVPESLVVFGNALRVGETARKYLLDTKVNFSKFEKSFAMTIELTFVKTSQCEQQPGYAAVVKMTKFSTEMQRAGQEFSVVLTRLQLLGSGVRCRSLLWGRAWQAYCRHRHGRLWRCAELLKDWALRVGAAGLSHVQCVVNACKSDVLLNSRIMLCTIATTSGMLKEWEETCPGGLLHTHTVIVDESGCTTESSVALLMRYVSVFALCGQCF